MEKATMKRSINEQLAHYKSYERNEAITMLVFLGLKYHSIMCPHENKSSTQSLNILCERLLREYPSHRKQLQLEEIEKSRPSTLMRKHRPDAMFHFPFADPVGSVPDILDSSSPHSHAIANPSIHDVPTRLLQMGAPARKRLVEKVFDEMRLDRNGIRMSDLPEALHRLGINISHKLRRVLERTRSKLVNGPLALGEHELQDAEGNSGDINPIMTQYMEKVIPLALWKVIVRNFLVLMKQGREPHEVDGIFPNMSTTHKAQPYVEDEDYFDNLSDSDEVRRPNETRYQRRKDSQYYDDEEGNEVDAVLTKAKAISSQKNRHHSTPSGNKYTESQQREHSQRSLSRQTQEYYRKVKTVPSRLSNVIQHDRNSYHQQRRAADSAAFEKIAERKLDHYLRNPPGIGFNNSIYQLDPSKNQGISSGMVKNHKKYLDLDSGSAAMEIANGFLASKIGQEMMSLAESDFDSQIDEDLSLSPQDALDKAGKLLGIPSIVEMQQKQQWHDQVIFSTKTDRSNKIVINGSGSGKSIPAVDSVPTKPIMQSHISDINFTDTSATAFKSMRDRQLQQTLDDQAKELYQSGWQSKKAGWVADFGAEHTHAFYTGPDRHRTSFSNSLVGNRVAQQESRPLRTSVKIDGLTYPNVDKQLGQFIYGSGDASVSSTSLDLAIAGAGANVNTGLYDDDSLTGSQNFDGDFSDKLHDSVSLKEISNRSAQH